MEFGAFGYMLSSTLLTGGVLRWPPLLGDKHSNGSIKQAMHCGNGSLMNKLNNSYPYSARHIYNHTESAILPSLLNPRWGKSSPTLRPFLLNNNLSYAPRMSLSLSGVLRVTCNSLELRSLRISLKTRSLTRSEGPLYHHH